MFWLFITYELIILNVQNEKKISPYLGNTYLQVMFIIKIVVKATKKQ